MIRLMRSTQTLFALALTAALPALLPAQSPAPAAHTHAAAPVADSTTKRMKTPCPLHLTTLELTPVQDTALRAIRAAHMAEMKAVKARLAPTAAKSDTTAKAMHTPELKDAMQASMKRAREAVRATLGDAQRVRFDEAAAAHAAEKDAMAAAGSEHACECCDDHAKDGHAKDGHAKKEGAAHKH